VLAPISDDLSSSYDYQGQRAYFVAAENKIHIFERYRLYSRPAVLYEDAKIGLLHEYGHALDAHAKLSASEQFQEAYTDDCDKLSSGPRQTLWYFTQAGSRGPAETFAACFAIENDPDHADDSQIARYFPRCFSVVKSIVSSYRK
jgi:hypothetical protein